MGEMELLEVKNLCTESSIILKLKSLVASERKITSEIIAVIQEIDRTKSYLPLGYSNLYLFLTEHIGYAPASAQRRIEAARLLTSVPEVAEDVKSGELSLSQVSWVAQAIRQKQKESPLVEFKAEDKKILLESIKGKTLEASQVIVSQTLDLEIKAVEKKRVQQDESVRVELTLSKEQMEMLGRVKSLMSHVNPNPSVAEVFEYLAHDFLKRKDPLLRKGPAMRKEKCRDVTSATEVKKQNQKKIGRYIPAPVKRFVWKRDQGKCQFIHAPTGRKCESKHLIEIDHVKRFRNCGEHSPENLRLLCDHHNRQRG